MKHLFTENFKDCLSDDLKWTKKEGGHETWTPKFMSYYEGMKKKVGEELTINEFVILYWLDMLQRPRVALHAYPGQFPTILARTKNHLNDDSLFDFSDIWCAYLKYKDKLFTEQEQHSIEDYKKLLMECYY